MNVGCDTVTRWWVLVVTLSVGDEGQLYSVIRWLLLAVTVSVGDEGQLWYCQRAMNVGCDSVTRWWVLAVTVWLAGWCILLFVEPTFSGCSVTSSNYHSWRCRAGVGEGTVDFPPNQSFPLEANLDFMNGGTVLIAQHLTLNVIWAFRCALTGFHLSWWNCNIALMSCASVVMCQ